MCGNLVKRLTCPLQVTDDDFVAQLTGVPATLVGKPRLLHSDWLYGRTLTLSGDRHFVNVRFHFSLYAKTRLCFFLL